jgi:nitrate/nitrite transporter NarK
MFVFGISINMNLYIIVGPIFCLFLLCGFVYPNVMAACFNLFPTMSGTVSALFGSITAISGFFITAFATIFKTSTQIPMSIMYMVLMFICLILFLVCRKSEGYQESN